MTSVTLLGAQRGVHMRREDSVGDGLMGAGGIDWSGAELLLSLAAQVQREQASALAAPVTHPCPEASLRCSTAAVAHRLSKKVGWIAHWANKVMGPILSTQEVLCWMLECCGNYVGAL